MGLHDLSKLVSRRRLFARWAVYYIVMIAGTLGWAQSGSLSGPGYGTVSDQSQIRNPSVQRIRSRRFLAGRTLSDGVAAATAIDAARQQHATMLVRRPVAALAEPRLSGLSAGWQPVGPGQVATLAYGNVTGRVSSIAIDPADVTGNTVYLGTTGVVSGSRRMLPVLRRA